MNRIPDNFSPYEERLLFRTSRSFDLPVEFWIEIAAAAGAEVLAHTSTRCVDSPRIHHFLLSTSSLFVFERTVILLTCAPVGVKKALGVFLDNRTAFPPLSIEIQKRFPPTERGALSPDILSLLHTLPDGEALTKERLFRCAHQYSWSQWRDDTTPLSLLFFGARVGSVDALAARLQSAINEPCLTLDHTFFDGGYSLNIAWGEESFLSLHSSPHAYLSADISPSEPLRAELLSIVLSVVDAPSIAAISDGKLSDEELSLLRARDIPVLHGASHLEPVP